jgi:phenylpropionate dioxygenase-like ring-hydroxylating dioxygenase large terminal subunit
MVTDLGAALEQGWTLPAEWYSDPQIHRVERERIFTSTWQYAGPTAWTAEPGDFFASFAGHVPVLVVRDEDGALRALVNVCRHRGHIVAQGRGRRQTLQCPYHAWTYGLDGRLRNAPRSEREPGFDRDAFGLLPAAVDTWGPLVFVNPDPDAAPLADTLRGLPDVVSGGGLDLDTLHFRDRQEFEIPANWKVVVENFLECYHCPVAHPSFSDLIDVDPDAYRLESNGLYSSQVAPVRDAAIDRVDEAAYDARGEVSESQFHYLWPTFTLNVLPGPANMSALLFLPDGPAKTRSIIDYFFIPGVDETVVQEMVAFGNVVGREDSDLVASVQRGLNSGMVPQGRLLLSSEHLIQHFQRLVYDALG